MRDHQSKKKKKIIDNLVKYKYLDMGKNQRDFKNNIPYSHPIPPLSFLLQPFPNLKAKPRSFPSVLLKNLQAAITNIQ